MSKRLSALLLAAVLILLIIPAVPASAAGDVIALRTPQDVIDLSRSCVLDTWSQGREVTVENDIDLSGYDCPPIPLFGGHLDGKGHTISGVKLSGAVMTAGFIRTVTAGGTVENLNISGEITPEGSCVIVGGIAGENNGTVRGCTFKGDVRGYEAVGGICGVCGVGGIIENCRAEGYVSGEHRAGGIAGDNAGIVRSCISSADVNTELTEATPATESGFDLSKIDLSKLNLNLTLSAEELVDITDIGGIAGFSSGVIRGCENKGEVGHLHIGYNVGGIAGRLSGYADTCVNSGKVFGRKDVGGIAGQIDPYTGWDFSSEKLSELQSKLGSLRGSISGLADDLASYSSELSEKLVGVMDSLSSADSALETLSGDAVTFINDNIGTVNQLSERITEALGDAVPVLEELGSFIGELPGVMDTLSDALDKLAEAAGITDSVYNDVCGDVEAAKTAIANAIAAVNDIKQSVSAFIKAPDITAVGTLLKTVVQKLGVIRTELTKARDAAVAARDALNRLPEAAGPAADALSLLSQTADSVGSALDCLARAEELFTSAVDTLSRYDAISFSPVNNDEDARRTLFSALGESFTGFRSVAELLGDSRLSGDIQAVSDDFFALVDFAVDAIGGGVTASDMDVLSDISADGTLRTEGTVRNCRNLAAADAETNCGGIVGAISIDVSFDLEDEFNISSFLTGSTRYLIYACVADSVNISAVTAKKEAAGGIVGRMDYGAVMRCESSGEVTVQGSYAGGIAGLSRGYVQGCAARVNLSADSYVGGVAGSGSDISGCYAIPSIAQLVAYSGAIAGDADGTVSGNLYAACDIGGVNGFSYSGKAHEVSYDELVRLSGSAELFGTVTVTFMKDGEAVSAVNVPFGGKVDALPEVPDKDGKSWRWDSFDNTAVYRSITVEGSYVSPVTVLSSGEEVPMFLVEGSFGEGQSLRAVPYTDPGAESGEGYTLSVDGYYGVLRVHMRAGDGGKLTVVSAGGGRSESDYTRDGSYIVFDLDNGGSFIYTEAQQNIWLYIAIGAGAAVVIVIALILIIRAKKRSKKALKHQK